VGSPRSVPKVITPFRHPPLGTTLGGHFLEKHLGGPSWSDPPWGTHPWRPRWWTTLVGPHFGTLFGEPLWGILWTPLGEPPWGTHSWGHPLGYHTWGTPWDPGGIPVGAPCCRPPDAIPLWEPLWDANWGTPWAPWRSLAATMGGPQLGFPTWGTRPVRPSLGTPLGHEIWGTLLWYPTWWSPLVTPQMWDNL
jgi:hypothetical protein